MNNVNNNGIYTLSNTTIEEVVYTLEIAYPNCKSYNIDFICKPSELLDYLTIICKRSIYEKNIKSLQCISIDE